MTTYKCSQCGKEEERKYRLTPKQVETFLCAECRKTHDAKFFESHPITEKIILSGLEERKRAAMDEWEEPIGAITYGIWSATVTDGA